MYNVLQSWELVDDCGENSHITGASQGAATCHHTTFSQVSRSIPAGEAIVSQCDMSDHKYGEHFPLVQYSVQWLEENGVCVDNLKVGPSTIHNAGRGVFATRFIKQDNLVAVSPMMHIDRHDLDGGTHKHLLLNYVIGQPNSTYLFLPTASAVNYINHGEPNVGLIWVRTPEEVEKQNNGKSSDRILREADGLVMEVRYVAIRDISPGEEIFLDYGPEWEDAWQEHMTRWEAQEVATTTSTLPWDHAIKEICDDHVRTLREQEKDPFPEHLSTACVFRESKDDNNKFEAFDSDGYLMWNSENHNHCVRPCDITYRSDDGMHYRAIVYNGLVKSHPECILSSTEGVEVSNIPRDRIILAYKAYMSPIHTTSRVFRHEIGAPEGFFPPSWMDQRVSALPVRFDASFLQKGEIQRLRLDESDEEIVEWGFRMRIPSKLRTVLLDFATANGIVDELSRRVIHGDPLPAGGNQFLQLGGHTWWETRFGVEWRSNLHYVTPAEDSAMEAFLNALSQGGFDTVLQNIGEHFQLDGLLCYYMSFIAVSHCSKGHMHADSTNTGGKGFNIIFPLLLVNGSGPELDLRADNGSVVVGYQYRFDEATIVGDDAFHGTASCDYRGTGDMRFVASVYLADVNSDNIDSFWDEFVDVPYPPKDNFRDFFSSRMGSHWKADDSSIRLPQYKVNMTKN